MKQKITTNVESDFSNRSLAILIDADNAPADIAESLFQEIAGLGEVSVRRIYGDLSAPQNAGWRNKLNIYAINPIQQYAYTKGKNATDCRLIIDAMDLMYTRRFDGFCLVSSDSDFTSLAIRIKEEGLKVFGFGEQKTPQAFIKACHEFMYLEKLRQPVNGKKNLTVSEKTAEISETTENNQLLNIDIEKMLIQAVEENAKNDGWALLSTIGSYLLRIRPDFLPKNYGFKKLTDLLKSKPNHFILDQHRVRCK